ncbi:hypothetical protein M0R45_034370 [Rubus argutus]|uniref:Uncharacterized protein n=1 Tax=Rubus argutus TaxID=59490 RepID=A0AAW1VVD5_RUBAR
MDGKCSTPLSKFNKLQLVDSSLSSLHSRSPIRRLINYRDVEQETDGERVRDLEERPKVPKQSAALNRYGVRNFFGRRWGFAMSPKLFLGSSRSPKFLGKLPKSLARLPKLPKSPVRPAKLPAQLERWPGMPRRINILNK